MSNRDAGLAQVCIGIAVALVGYLASAEYFARLGVLIAAIGLVFTAVALMRGRGGA